MEKDWTFEKLCKYEVYRKLASVCTHEMVRLTEECTSCTMSDEKFYKLSFEDKVWMKAFDLLWGTANKVADSD
jgi:hypothetical protein